MLFYFGVVKMMMKKLLLGGFGAIAIFGSAMLHAATVSVAGDTANYIGNNVSFTIAANNFTDPNGLFGGSIVLEWDTSVLSLASTGAEINASAAIAGFGFPSRITPLITDLGAGINRIYIDYSVTDIFAPKMESTFDFVTLVFTVVAEGSTTVALGANPDPGQVSWVNGVGSDISSAVTSYGSIQFTALPSPVPVPAAVWLFASAMLGMLGVQRRRRHSTAMVQATA